MARGETPERLQPRIEERASQIMQGFERKPLAAGVTQGNARLNMAAVARQEIARLIAEQDALTPRAEPIGLDIGAPKRATPAQQAATEGAKPATEGGESVAAKAESATPEKDPADMASPSQADADPTIQLADEIMSRVEDMHLPTGAWMRKGDQSPYPPVNCWPRPTKTSRLLSRTLEGSPLPPPASCSEASK